jgi:hypothetical protein
MTYLILQMTLLDNLQKDRFLSQEHKPSSHISEEIRLFYEVDRFKINCILRKLQEGLPGLGCRLS